MISYKTGFSRLFISLFHFFSIKLLIAFLPSVAYASIMSYSGSGGNYVINWNCTSNNYFCSLHKDGSEIYRSGSGEKSYPITLGVGQYEFVLRTYSIGNLGHVSLVDTDTITITNLPAPSTPSTPTVPSTNNTGSYTISWSSAANASRYTLEEKVGSGNWSLLGNPTGTSYNKTLTTSNTYYYRVQACNDASCSAFSPSSAGINVAITPGVPPTITAPALHDGDFNVSWGSASGSISKYDLDQSFNGGSYTNSYDGTATSTSFTNLAAGTYVYRVRACRTTGSYTSCSGWRTSGNSVAAAPGSVPGNFAVPANDSDGAYVVSWGSVSNASSYTLQERIGSGSWSTIQNTAATSRSVSGKGNQTYGYRVAACNDLGCTGYTAENTIHVAIAPDVPASITATPQEGGVINVVWNAVSGSISKYDLDESKNGAAYTNAYDGSALTSQLGSRNGSYQYRVRACVQTGSFENCSGWRTSSIVGVSALLLDLPATSEGTFTITFGGGTSYTQLQENVAGNWQTVAGANGSNIGEHTFTKPDGTYTFRLLDCAIIPNPPANPNTECTPRFNKSIVVDAPTPAIPSAPQVPSTNNTGSFTLTWNEVSPVTHYDLQENIGNENWPVVASPSNASINRAGKENGEYTYRVRACNGSDCSVYSPSSTVVSVAITPGVPSTITAPALHDGDFNVSWGSASGSISKYDLDQSFNGGSYTNSYDGTATSKSFTNLAAGTYVYRVRACRTTGSYTSCSGWRTSGNSVAAAPGSVPGSFAVPANDSDGAYVVSWGSVSNASSYTLQERIGSGSWSTIQNTAATSRSISGKGNQTYGYRVAACNDLGCSSYTAEKIVQVAVTPSVPPVLVATADNGNIDISWSASSGTVTRYDLDESVDGGTSYTNLYDGVELSKHVENRVGTYQYRIRACSLWGSYESCSDWRYSEIANTYRFLDVPALSNTSQFSVRWTSSALGSFQQAYALLQEQVDGSWVTLEGASVGTIGQRDFSRPDGTYTFGLYDCKVSAGQAGTSTSCNTVLTKTVVVDAPAPVVNASFNKSSINEAASANLTWSASGASTCSATGIVGVSGLSGTVTYSAPAEVLSAFTQSVVLTCTGFGGVTSKTVNLLVNPVNDPPTISSIPSITARINTTSNPVSFAVNDVDNNNGSLTLKVLSTNNSALLPITNVSFGGTAGNRTLRVSPVAGQAGNATLVIQVSDGHLTASTSVNVEVREGPVIPIFSGNPLATVADPLNDTLSGDVYYGGVKGAYSVGNDGSFRYDVPFIVPVGVQGIAPNVGVNYNSGRRNSIIGWGWELTGFSFIHRCPADYHRDGRTSGVRDEDNYQYCLDGARLVSIGSDQYRTENETFLHITKHNDYWTVVDQSGTSSRYGYDQNAKELSANGTHTWKLDRQEDTFGNYLTVTYDAGQVNGADYSRPSNITYTQNDSLAYMPKRELIFNYSPRNDIISGFRSGKEYIENKRLSSVTVKNNGAELWTWRLRYEDENSNKVVDDPAAKSQLDSIQRCFKSNSCEEALTINWAPRRLTDYQYVSMDNTFSERRTSLGDVQHYFDIDGDGIEDGYSGYADTATLSYVDDVSGAQTFVPESEFIDIDINNDGYKDIVRINPTISGVLVYLNEADGNGGRRIAATANSNYSVNKTHLSFQGTRRYQEYMNIGTEFQSSRVHRRTATYGYNIKFVDFNRDGLVDLVRFPPDCTNGSFFCFFESEPYPQDISVLLNTDQGWRKTNNQLHFAEIYNQWGNQNSETAIQFMDLNGDGFLDVYAAGRDPENKVSYLYYLLHNGASDIDNVTLTDVTSSSGWGLLKEYLGDFDGDGLTDFATVPALSSVNGPTAEVISVRRGRGGSYTEATVALADADYLPGCAQGHSPLSYCIQTVVDFNNDGLDDIVQMSGCQYIDDLKYDSAQERQSLSQEISRCIQQMNSTGGWNAEQVWLSKGIDANGDVKFAAPVIYRKDSSISFAYARMSMSQFTDYNGDGIKENNPGFTPAFKELRVESIQSHAQDITIQYQSFDMTSVLLNSGDAFGDPQLKQLYKQNDSYIDGMQVKRSATQFGVSSLDISNGVGGTNKIEYRYAGAKYDTASYGHLGFKTIESTEYVDGEDNYIRTESHYHQEANNLYSLPRKLKRRVRYAAENGNETLLSDIRYKWKVRLYEDDDDGHQSPHFFAYIYEQSEKTSDLSGSAMSTTVTRHYASNNYACTELGVNDTESIATYYAGSAEDTDYDDEGILRESVSIICDADSNDALAPTAMTQIVAMQNADVINLGARRGLVQATRNASWFGPSSGLPVGDLWSQAVNGISSSASCSIVQGQSVPWISETQFSFTDDGLLQSKIERPDAGPGKTLTKTFDYNVSGNIKTITESWVNAPGDTSLGFNSRVTSTEETFNSNSQRVVTTTTPLGQSVAVYHSVYDTPISQTDVNQMTTSTQYDELGRIKLISYPNNTNTVIDYRACDGCFSEAAHERAYTQTKTTGQAASRAYVDRLGRSVGSRSRGLDGRFIYTTVAYNSQGLPEQSTAAYYSGDVHQISTTYYDVLGRPKQILQPDSYSSYISYHGLKTLLTNVNGQTQKRYNSASGHVLRNIDHAETPVDFTYWPDGSTKTTEVGGGANPETQVCIGVDDMGRKNFLDDPNTGRITYAYNALGFLSAQADANGQVTRYQYDQLGRTITRRDDAEGDNYLHTWNYDTQWLGLPDTLEGTTTDGGSYQETYTYNNYGQPTVSSATYSGRSWSSSASYDDYGRPLETTYPGGYAVANIYGDWGHLNQVVENTRQQILWQADEANALGQVTLSRLGDNSVVERIYTPETGRIEKITSTREGDTLMNQYYEFDSLGNLLSRLDLLGNQAEAFCYDQLNRLKASRLDSCGAADIDFSYDSLGNILTKQGVTGTYQYGSNAGPHAVTSANGLSYHYDNNGNLIEARNGSNQVVRKVDYSVMNMPTHIEKGGRSTDIIYGATHKRIKRVDSNGSSITRTTWYFGDRYEESTDAAGITRKTYYIGDFAQRIEEVQSGISYHEFLHKDHLGSIVKRSSDLSYSDLAATLFGAWGARLQGGWGSAPTGPDFNAHNVRGFTGHEHLDPVGLIHMNGRVYDPELGRFLSPDPVVQAPYNTQNYNRYSYVWNNPLSLVDPSGYYCRGPDSLSNLMIQTALSQIEGMHQQAAMDSVRFIAKVGALKAMQMASKSGEPQGGGGAAGGDALEEAQSPSASSQPVSSTTDDAKAQSASVKPVSYESAKAVQDVKQTVVNAKSVAPAQKSSLTREELIEAHSELRTMVHGTASAEPDAYIYLSKANQETLYAYELMQTLNVDVSKTSYVDNFVGADTFIYQDGLASRNFLLEGYGMVKGGEFNYISVGMMAAHYDHSLVMVPMQTVAWNGLQLLFGQGGHNYTQMFSGSFWGGAGYEYYNQHK